MTYKFIKQILTNSGSKTYSATKAGGALVILVGTLGFIAGVIDKMRFTHTADIVTASVWFTSLGAAMLGVKNVFPTKSPLVSTEETEETKTSKKTTKSENEQLSNEVE